MILGDQEYQTYTNKKKLLEVEKYQIWDWEDKRLESFKYILNSLARRK